MIKVDIVVALMEFLVKCREGIMLVQIYPRPCPQLSSVCCDVLSRSVVSDALRPLDCSPPGSSVHGVLQARILEWAAVPSSRELPSLAAASCAQSPSLIP